MLVPIKNHILYNILAHAEYLHTKLSRIKEQTHGSYTVGSLGYLTSVDHINSCTTFPLY